MSVPEPAAHMPRPRPSRGAVALVVALDVLIATTVGFSVYFATRRFGPPTIPNDLRATATTCVPDECDTITPTVALAWRPPVAGGTVTRYLLFRNGAELDRVGAGTTEYLDEDVVIGEEYEYEVLAVGEEGRGPTSSPVAVQVPVPALSAARLVGDYRVVVTLRQIDLLSRYEGIKDPSAGDSTVQFWSLFPLCEAAEGACDVRLFREGPLTRDGRDYAGDVPDEAFCGKKKARSTQTITLRVTAGKVFAGILTATAFEGSSEVDFRCGGRKIHAVALIDARRFVPEG